ncbi:unnamed protein product [Rotaria sordida]|uniref:Uncharacterized protein n=1 Tax=Rotaria sordida TaxID=392033 RepID=A0A819MT19_9BILA|nr:unnamed protein product [Rotaria sordida]
MKRKTPCTSPIKIKSNPDSTGHIEENSSDDLSLKETAENCPDNQPNEKKVADKGIIWNQIGREQFISAVNNLGPAKKQLDKETWRLNDFTRSKESVWGRLISKLNLNHTENIRHPLDEPIGRDSIVARIRAIGDENHSAGDKGTARNLTGQDRMDVGRLANEIGPLKVFQQKVENANEEMLSARNFTGYSEDGSITTSSYYDNKGLFYDDNGENSNSNSYSGDTLSYQKSKKYIESTAEQLKKQRESKKQSEQMNPFYLKDFKKNQN